jgi:predicted sulfurtransferase
MLKVVYDNNSNKYLSNMESSTDLATGRKKRLNRKEQKARKKQRNKDDSISFPHDEAKHDIPRTDAENPASPPTQLPYEPIAIPTQSSNRGKSLGKWFPKAVIVKSKVYYTNADIQTRQKNNTSLAVVPTASIVLFYQYITPIWPESKVDCLIAYLQKIAQQRVLGGRIRVAREGVNATISSVDDANGHAAATTLQYLARDLERFDKVFEQTQFKYANNLSADRHFSQLNVYPVQELVYYNMDETSAPLSKGGEHVPPRVFHELLEKETAVVVDIRNHYEAAIGRFDGQAQSGGGGGGAAYIDPKMRKSTDLKDWLDQEATKKQLEGKQVLLFCTGGVRCERASAYINGKMGQKVNGIFQLQGGIEAYMQEFADGGHWRGKNFVFDKREAVSVDNPNGDGGVICKQTRASLKEATCVVCNEPWDRYVGKKKCSTCGVPVLMCDSCMSKKPLTETSAVRCPLCVEQSITVPANEVEFTENGVHGKRIKGHTGNDDMKAAPSVLKWGGGHASTKKDRRRFRSQACRFGADCKRSDCFFAHPDKKKQAVDS